MLIAEHSDEAGARACSRALSANGWARYLGRRSLQ
jgi:hypothetical protein